MLLTGLIKLFKGKPNSPASDALWRALNYQVKNTLPYKIFIQVPPKMMREAEHKPFAPNG